MKYVHLALIMLQAALGAAAADGALSAVITDPKSLGIAVSVIALIQLVAKGVDGMLTKPAAPVAPASK